MARFDSRQASRVKFRVFELEWACLDIAVVGVKVSVIMAGICAVETEVIVKPAVAEETSVVLSDASGILVPPVRAKTLH